MAKKSTAAQHFLECDNCEEHPAKFLCKSCPGHLCENCKTEHEKKKMTRSHKIVSLISNNENMVDLLYCKDHTKKKLECYCNRCKEPVCTDCIIQSHNGHSVESLSTVYKRTTDQAREQIEKIDNILLPKYRELVSNETAKESALKRRAEEIKKKIEAHTESLVEMIKTIGTQTVEDLSKKEKDGLREIEQTTNNFKKQIDELQLMSRKISADIEAKPGISFFKLVERNNLERFEKSQPDIDYSLTDFQPGDIKLGIEDSFGIRPILQRSGHDRFTDEKINRKPVRANNSAPSRALSAHEREELRREELRWEEYQRMIKTYEELRQ
ncbi:E3 ubiquitin-protein ligase TRIM45-like [Magallana gigas]|uniref:E3 ubiquitin-protein ligase TRIM45-like n=1 Tax=Magallana gigas TaxID=29159 RepID=UPI00333F08E8